MKVNVRPKVKKRKYVLCRDQMDSCGKLFTVGIFGRCTIGHLSIYKMMYVLEFTILLVTSGSITYGTS